MGLFCPFAVVSWKGNVGLPQRTSVMDFDMRFDMIAGVLSRCRVFAVHELTKTRQGTRRIKTRFQDVGGPADEWQAGLDFVQGSLGRGCWPECRPQQ
jgi:hypothetical protein